MIVMCEMRLHGWRGASKWLRMHRPKHDGKLLTILSSRRRKTRIGGNMNQEQLIALGLTEEQATSVLKGIEDSQMIPKTRFDEVNNAKKALETQVSDYAAQLDTLKSAAKGNEELQNQIKALQEAQVETQKQYQQALVDAKVDSAIQLAVNGKVHDVGLVSGLIDRSLIKLSEDGKVLGGLDDQISTLKNDKSFLFVQEAPATPTAPTFNPVGVVPTNTPTDPTPQASLGSVWAQKMNQQQAAPKGSWGQ